MKKEIADKWVEALRSGKYKQCIGVLFDGTGHCCLGVLCEVVGMKPEFRAFGNSGHFYYAEHHQLLPAYAQEFSGMQTEAGQLGPQTSVRHPEKWATLTELNDSGGSFDIIADIIEGSWEQL